MTSNVLEYNEMEKFDPKDSHLDSEVEGLKGSLNDHSKQQKLVSNSGLNHKVQGSQVIIMWDVMTCSN
jgi:hypothetical protein